MKLKIITTSIFVLIAIISYFIYEMYPFVKGVQNDAKKRKEFLENKAKNADSIYFIQNDTKNSNH